MSRRSAYTSRALPAANGSAPQQRDSVIGAAALDLMAAIAGPPSTAQHARAWRCAVETVLGVMAAGAGGKLAAAA